MPPAISIENLGKRYLVDHEAQRGYRTLRESLVNLASAPLRRLRGQRSATREEFWALKDVTFDVQPGEVVGIIGRNGAGKSTLLKILSQITKPTKGRVRLNGRVGSLLEVGTGFHPELTGRENIYLNGSILGMTRREIARKFDEIVAFAEIETFLDTPVKRYSSGMYVRLAFAVAAHLEPEILIVDEVLAVGDAAFQKKCLNQLGSLATSGSTVLLVSHHLPTISSLCSHALLLVDGQCAGSGETAKVVTQYREMGGGASATFHHSTPYIRWEGLNNATRLASLSPIDDLTLELEFTSGTRPLQDVHIDVALHNETGVEVLHARSSLVSDGLAISPNSRCQIDYSFLSPHLAPGHYLLTLYVSSGREVLLWADNISACQIDATAHFGKFSVLPKLRGVVVPPFTVSMRSTPLIPC
jgi:lipopolysaccharide transport system ATP-binding protein